WTRGGYHQFVRYEDLIHRHSIDMANNWWSMADSFTEFAWAMRKAPETITTGHSPVHTIQVIGQSLGADGKTPLASIKLNVTVERTWDGRMNVLEYRVVTYDLPIKTEPPATSDSGGGGGGGG
ncbi:MAG: hypothetical protein N3A38_05825, partial [Planctomycetota bacterium]|nr:hypothetical protein [Planctomycetota bacterium]